MGVTDPTSGVGFWITFGGWIALALYASWTNRDRLCAWLIRVLDGPPVRPVIHAPLPTVRRLERVDALVLALPEPRRPEDVA